ncbi:MAG: hypothetical protein ACHREM_24430 [Polyangiales bacterium]
MSREESMAAAAAAAARYLATGDLAKFDEVKVHLSAAFGEAGPAFTRYLASTALVALVDMDEVTRMAADVDAGRCPLCAHKVEGRPFR